jgi:hypothetical protein
MEWYWIYLIIGVCLYIIARVTDAIEADGLFKRMSAALIWPKVVYATLEFLLTRKGRDVK